MQPSHLLGSALAASASVVAGALAGCQRPSTLKVAQPTTGGGRDDLSDSVIGKDKIRIGMEAAYAPYNWQVPKPASTPSPSTTCRGAYADGYDVQIAKIVCKAPRWRARCRQTELLGSHRFAQQRPNPTSSSPV